MVCTTCQSFQCRAGLVLCVCNCQVHAVRAILQCRIGDVYADAGCAGNIILCYCVLTELPNKEPMNSSAKLPPGKPLEMVWVMNDLGK